MGLTPVQLPGLDAERVGLWLSEHVPGLAHPLSFALVSGGRSNLTYRGSDAAGRSFAVRRPPVGDVLASAHDMRREWTFISALHPTDVPVPPPLAFCDDLDVAGCELYAMDFIDGTVLADHAAGLAFPSDARLRASEQVVDVLVALHGIDPVAVGLGDMVRRTGYLQRQLRRWSAQVRATGLADVGPLDEVHDLLAAHVPPQSTGIVHGDYRPGNMSFAPDGTAVAVFDWELATTGDPLADLGWLAATWQEPGEDLPLVTPTPSTAPAFLSRADLVERYARASGRDVSNLPYWVAFSRWRSACINAGVRARYRSGQMADDGYLDTLRASSDLTEALGESARQALRELGL